MNPLIQMFVIASALVVPQGRARSAAPVSFDHLAKHATEARKADRLEEAIGLYRQAVKRRPSYAEGWWYLSTILYDLDRYEEARDALRRFIPLQPAVGPGYAMLGLCEFQLRDYERAETHLLRAQALGFGGYQALSSVARYHLALLLTRSERYEEAGMTLASLVKEGNQSPSMITALGLNVLCMPFLPIEMPPDKREIVYRAGHASLAMINRQIEDAKREYEELVARFPNEPNAHYAYGVLLLEIDPSAAVRELSREIEISPAHVAARMQLALDYVRRGEHAAALPYAEEAVKRDPRNFVAHRTLGRVLLVMGDIPRAIAELEAAVKLAPKDTETHYALATAYTRAGRKEDAQRERAEFSRLREAEPK